MAGGSCSQHHDTRARSATHNQAGAVRQWLADPARTAARAQADGAFVVAQVAVLPIVTPAMLPAAQPHQPAPVNLGLGGLPTAPPVPGSADSLLLGFMREHDPSPEWAELATLITAAGGQATPACICGYCSEASAGTCANHTPAACPPRNGVGWQPSCDAAKMSRATVMHAASIAAFVMHGRVTDLAAVVPLGRD